MGLAFFVVALSAISMSRGSALIAPLWSGNALGMVFILRWARSHADAAAAVLAILCASIAANALGGLSPLNAVWLSCLNAIQVSVGCALVRRFSTTTFHTLGEGWRFFFLGGVAPSLLGAFGVLALCWLTARPNGAIECLNWAGVDILSFILVAPLGITVSVRELAKLDLSRRWLEATGLSLLLLAVTLAVFAQNILSLLFLVAPLILLATFRFGLIGAHVAMLIVAATAIPMTAFGLGPLTLLQLPSLGLKLMTLQVFLAANGLSVVPLASALAERDDLTARGRRREEDLQKAARIAELADEIATSGHWALVLSTGEQHWSAGVYRVFGLPVAAKPPALGEIIALFAQDEQEAVREAFHTARRERCALEFERAIVRPDGAVRHVRLRSQYLVFDGVHQLLGVIRDVTAERDAIRSVAESERDYRMLIEAVTDCAIYRLDVDGHVAGWNAAAEIIEGYAAADIIGRHLSTFYTENDAKAGLPARALAIAASEGRFVDEGWRIRKDGTRFRASVAIEAIREAGELAGFAKTTRDVTARHAADLELQQALREANTANVVKSNFLANMSHEIRTPLHSIMGFSGLLAETQGLQGDARRHAEIVHASSGSLLRIVDDILDISKFEVEGVSLSPEPSDLGDLILNTVELVRVSAAAKGVALCVNLTVDPGPVLVDPHRIRQVLLNLFSNALKFTPSGSVSATLSEDDGGVLKIAVQDTGVGIPTDRLAAIFERFAQADASTSRQYGGTGLGLAICRSIVSAMGGELSVESTEGVGSTFAFTFAPSRLEATRSSATVPTSTRVRGGLRVLLADDNELNRDLFGALMADQGLVITYAMNGADAVRAVLTEPYDIVFLDVQMPVMDGMEASRAIRAAGFADLPIVALTANVLASQIERFRSSGMNAHLGKPYGATDILKVIAKWTGRGRRGEIATDVIASKEPLIQLSKALGEEKTLEFLSDLSTQLSAFLPRLACPHTPPRALAQEAHRVRGFAATLGFYGLSDAYADLEKAAEDAPRAEALRDLALIETRQSISEIARAIAA